MRSLFALALLLVATQASAQARTESGAFVTYLSADGAGYVRTIASSLKAAASLMSATETQFDSVEHVVFGLRSVTYYGKAK